MKNPQKIRIFDAVCCSLGEAHEVGALGDVHPTRIGGDGAHERVCCDNVILGDVVPLKKAREQSRKGNNPPLAPQGIHPPV